ncbi:hypothetical protein KDN24_14290 [Bacillus sp. Bva_UNVM-123]|uniref:hypothetical protein n=1 Tax=Bacillus sp. Bva_UNVM-123 TaxID=2829798 RepID=UPI00391F502C
MVKKAIMSTVIFTLIIINLIMWPTLFSDFKQGSGEVNGVQEDGLQNEESAGQEVTSTDDDAEADLAEENVDDVSVDVDNGNVTSENSSKQKLFKILRIE